MALHQLDWRDRVPPECRGAVLSIGNFDGVHRGHQALIAQLQKLARELGAPAVVLTFDPHPLAVLAPERFEPILTTLPVRAALVQSAGADQVLALRTNPALLELSARQFFELILVEKMAIRGIVEGPNFGFGRRREGTVDLLMAFCSERQVTCGIVHPLVLDGEMVSSSKVRQALQVGDVDRARNLLGRPYRVAGVVGRGQQRGRTIGFPTANLEQIATLIPRDGVYAVRATLPELAGAHAHFAGAANIGPNPTFGEAARKVEVHLLGFAGDLLGQRLEIDFLGRLRDTRRFDSVTALVEQIQRDVQEVGAFLAKESTHE